MKKNVAAQTVGAQLISKTDGSAVTTGTTSVYYTGDNGVQSINSPGVATHKGNGYWEYSPDQSETNFDHVAFTFVNSSAVNVSVQIWTSFPQTGDNFARLGAPAGASVSADVAAVKSDSGAIKTQTDKLTFTVANVLDANALRVGGTVQTARDIGASVLLSTGTGTGQLDFTSGVVKANLAQILGTALTETAGQIAAGFKKFFNIATPAATMDHGVLVDTVTTATTATNLTNAPTAGDFTATMKTSITTAATAATPIAASVSGAVGSVTGNVGGNVTGSVGSVVGAVGSVTGLTASDVGAIKANTDKLGDTFEADSSPANFRFTAHALANAPVTAAAPSAASVATAVRSELTPELASVTRIETVTDKVGDMVEADSSPASYRYTAHALANAPSGGTAPTVTQIADEVQTRTIAAVTTVGAVTGNVGGNVVGSIGSLATQAKADVNAEADTALSDVGVTGTVTGRIDAAISTRLATSGYTAPLDAAGTRTAVGLATASLDTQLASAVGTRLIEGTYTHDDLLRLVSAVQLGKTTIGQNSPSGAVVTFRDVNDTVDRAVYEVSSNPAERLSSTLTP